MAEGKGIRDSFSELLDNLGVIGAFMLKELWLSMKKSWGGSREEFISELDRVKKTMIRSGKWAAGDIERAYEEIRKSWDLLQAQDKHESQSLLKDITNRLSEYGAVTREAFESAINSAKEHLDKQWKSMDNVGDDQLKVIQEQTSTWANSLKGQWTAFKEQMDRTGKRVDRSVNAAWEEWKKEEE